VLCGYARIGGWAVGIVANQKSTCRRWRAARTKSASNSARNLHGKQPKGCAVHSGLHQNRIPLISCTT